MSKEISQQEAIYLRLINKSEDYIEEHLQEPVSLADLANNAHLSEYHFHRNFKKYSQETVKSFISRFKLSRAAMFMSVNLSMSLTEIALKYGYNDASSFSRAFKRYFGCSPSRYRKEQEMARKK